MLSKRVGCELWLKHENYNPTGSFKVRDRLTYLSALRIKEPKVQGVIAAILTGGNINRKVIVDALSLN